MISKQNASALENPLSEASDVRSGRKPRPFVVAFNRDRDFYQVPLALQEANLLAGLVTDIYAPPLGPLAPVWPLSRFAKRRTPDLPFDKVAWNLTALRLQLLDLPRAQSGEERVAVFKQLDRALSRAALELALRREADLFLYSGYAREAFEDPRAQGLRKGLFVFHPHGRAALQILADDLEKHPEVAESHSWHRTEIELSDGERLDVEAGSADFLACASSFTAKSLAHVITSPQAIKIAPYGCFPASKAVKARRDKGPVRFLFVGQGVQRKGIHHLLKVWKQLHSLDATLTIIASSLDPGLRSIADQKGVTLLGAQSAHDLQRHYDKADVFIMPSLIEGFGLVYLEALSAGCYIIGTENTGLPDLHLPLDVGKVIQAGDLNALEAAIQDTVNLVNAGGVDPRGIQKFAEGLSWDAFRSAIRHACIIPQCS